MSPGAWSSSTLAPGEQQQHLLAAPPKMDDFGRRGSSESEPYQNDDYFSSQRSRVASSIGTPTEGSGFDNFLARANKQISRDQRHAPDPFLDGTATPKRPFGEHSRVSSRDSIASLVEEKQNSPLNKAIASVSFHCSKSGTAVID